MNITGLITEYNPFHNGHLYHIEQSRTRTDADYIIALMSGSHVQRGEPAIFDKYVRTRMALLSGADLVLEIPAAFSTASAMEFASYNIALLTALGAVDSVVFGSECGELSLLQTAADLLLEETPLFQDKLQQLLKTGMTYPQARAAAVPDDTLAKLLLTPNNILGIEYLKAARTLNSPLQFETICRQGSAYHETDLKSFEADGSPRFPSASALRNALSKRKTTAVSTQDLRGQIPDCCLFCLEQEIPVFADDYSLLLQDRLLRYFGSSLADWRTDRTKIPDISDLSPDLFLRLSKTGPQPLSFTERIQTLKSRQLTYTRISRALLHLILEIRTEDLQLWKAEGYAPYARILGFRKESAPLLKELKKRSSIPLITKMADAGKLLSPSALKMLEQEVLAAHLYQSVKVSKGGSFRNEYTEGILLL